ncbi:hypothetical protein [Yinghuangia soli]|uniref:WxL domain-containing protein n=1 Tax=Yinghuangia soli TaxID=2908204 RepID=A0AA41Q5H4_9ACTN|nr:hypothetical protein [Yinghuangia soli]MCF2531940.1 hypothetical protein [Yinghuangia soli]
MLRSMVPRRAGAVAAAGALTAAGLLAAAPGADAGTVTPVVECVLPAGQGTVTGPQDVAVVLDKSAVAPGGSLKGSVTLGPGPAVGTAGLSVRVTPSITLAMRGAATGEVTVIGEESTVQVEPGQAPPIPPFAGNFTVPAAAAAGGGIEFTVVKVVTDAQPASGGPRLPTVCTVKSGGDAAVAKVGVESPASGPATLAAPADAVRPGGTFTLTGAKFTPSAAPQISLCDAAGANCGAGRFTANTLAIDGQGNLSGSATLAAAGVPDGTYKVKVAGGEKQAQASLKVKAPAPAGPRTVELDRPGGPVGTTVAVTGRNWTPNGSVTVVQTGADGRDGPHTILAATDAAGSFATPYTVTDPATAKIRVREGISDSAAVSVPFALAAAPGPAPGGEAAIVPAAPGTLSMSQAGSGIGFGTATLDGEEQSLKAALNRITVVDTRGGSLGWSLTGTMTDLAAENGRDKIAAGSIGWAPACVAAAGSLSAVSPGAAGPLGSTPATLCSQAGSAAGPTGGQFAADAELTLTTPRFAAAGAYAGTLTLTLA